MTQGVGPHMYQQAQKVIDLIVKPCIASHFERCLDPSGRSDICKKGKERMCFFYLFFYRMVCK